MAPIYKRKQRRQLIVAIVCSVLVFALLLATLIVGLLHRSSLASKFEDEKFATAIAEGLGLSSRYDLKQEDLDAFEGLVYFWDIGYDSKSGSTYAYPIVMLCDKEYTDALIRQSDPDYEAPEGEETPDYSAHYKAVVYAPTEPADLNMFPNLRLLRTFDMAELNDMAYQCQMTQIYSMYGMGTAISMDAVLSAGKMAKLTSLEQLSSLTKLEQLSLCYTGVTNLKGIEKFPNLNKLDATYTDLTDLTGLDTASKLTYLGLNSVHVTPVVNTGDEEDEDETSDDDSEEAEDEDDKDKEKEKEKETPTFNESGLSTEAVELIAKLSALTYLDIANNNISDLSALSALKNVKYLSVANNPIASLSGVENMKGLEMLYASGCVLTDMKAVAGFDHLKTVYLSDNRLTDLSALSAATKVTYLDASDNLLTDASDVAGMADLETLNLSDNLLAAAPNLSKLTKAASVNLSDNCMTDASGLAKFDPTDFEIEEHDEDDEDKEDTAPTVTLNLSKNKLTEVTLKASMLTSLDLSDNKLTSLELTGCTSVATLNISENADLEAVPSLSKLTKLATLTATDTGLKELPELKDLKELTTVNLSRSAIESIDGLKDNKSITTLTLSECKKLTDIEMLCTITELSSVNFSKCTGLTDESIAAAFGTPKTGDKEASLRFPKDHKLTVTLTGCTGVKDYSIFDEYGEMKVTHDEKK